MTIPNNLIFNFLVDLKKKEIHPVERAELLRNYLESEKISARQLAKNLGMSHSTVQDWLDYGKLNVSKFNQLVKEGITKKEIHKMLRTERKTGKIKDVLNNELNRKLKLTLVFLMEELAEPTFNKETPRLLEELKIIIKKLEDKINGKQDGNNI